MLKTFPCSLVLSPCWKSLFWSSHLCVGQCITYFVQCWRSLHWEHNLFWKCRPKTHCLDGHIALMEHQYLSNSSGNQTSIHTYWISSQLSESKQPDKGLAKTMMVFMVRGLFTTQFPVRSLTGDLLFSAFCLSFWEAGCETVCILKVLGVTFDGARKLVRIHDPM